MSVIVAIGELIVVGHFSAFGRTFRLSSDQTRHVAFGFLSTKLFERIGFVANAFVLIGFALAAAAARLTGENRLHDALFAST